MRKKICYILVNPGSAEIDLLDELVDYGFEDLTAAKKAGNFGGEYVTVSGIMKVTVTVEEITK